MRSTTSFNMYAPAYLYSPYPGVSYPWQPEMGYYEFYHPYGLVDYDQYGPVEFTIHANQFTFNMKSDDNFFGGHVVFDWECMDNERFPKNPPPGWDPIGYYESETVVEGFVPEMNTAAPEATMIVTEG